MEYKLWTPWKGDSYLESKYKLFLIGESHYSVDDNGNFDKACYDDFISNKNTTIDVVNRFLNSTDEWKLFTNTHKVLFGSSKVGVRDFWSKVMFYNFIQRPMKSKTERPSPIDFKGSYEYFFEILNNYPVNTCIFLGNSSRHYFNEQLKKYGNGYTLTHEQNFKVGRYGGSKKTIAKDEKIINVYFIKHPSKYFSWVQWNKFLVENEGEFSKLLEIE